MKKKVVLLWIITGFCLILTVIFWFLMNNVDIKYEEVIALVTETSSKDVINKKHKNRTTLYDVKVLYDGEEYELQNVHGLSGYYKGKTVKVLLSNGKLYANIEGIKSTSPIAIIYFILLFGTLGMMLISATYMSKMKTKKQENIDEKW